MAKRLNKIKMRPETTVIKVDPILIRNSGIHVPRISYKVVAEVESEEAFTGSVVPIPSILIHFLNRRELRVISIILEEIVTTGNCLLTVREMARRMNVTTATVCNALKGLAKMRLILECQQGFNGKVNRTLNYKSIQHLSDLVANEDPGVLSRLRKATRKLDFMNMTKEDLKKSYDVYVLPPDHEPEEEEEYD